MKKNLKYFLILIGVCVAFMSCISKDGMPDMREKYSYINKNPFGAYTAHAMLEQFYDEKFIQLKDQSFYKTYNELSDTASVYFGICNKALFNPQDAGAILQFISLGNTVFLSANYFDSSLLTLIGAEQYSSTDYGLKNTGVKIVMDLANIRDSFGYFYYPFRNYFSKVNGDYCRIIGYNDEGKINCIIFFWGKGRLYLHTEPRALSNYFLLTGANAAYLHQYLQLLNPAPEHVYWDDYLYKHNYKDTKKQSVFSILSRYPALKYAFLIALVALLLYVLINGKRKQRVIPVIKPPENTSIAFAHAIAGLYLAEKDNKVIAEKMIAYFQEYVRSKYFLNTSVINAEFLLALSRKSGMPYLKTESLYKAIEQVSTSAEVDDFALISLRQQIEEFHKQ